MSAPPVRASADWLTLREPADAAARSVDLVEALLPLLPDGDLLVHDLGSGTGSMARWLAPRLPGPQHWVLHERDAELLQRARTTPPPSAADGGGVVRVECRLDDITRLDNGELAGASVVTASALLDMFTRHELERFVDGCVAAACPVLVTLSVIGRVHLTPADPLDAGVAAAFDAHQQRVLDDHPLLGPDAAALAVTLFGSRDMDVLVRPSPWQLESRRPGDGALVTAWLDGWVEAACEQDPTLARDARAYCERRRAAVQAGALSVVVHHHDLLAVPAHFQRSGRSLP